MIKNNNILLLEALNLFECQVLLKTETEYNKIDLFNQIRAVSGVVTLIVIHNDYLESKKTPTHEYSLIKIKYIVNKSPVDDIKILGQRVIGGDKEQMGKVSGVIQFLPRVKTIRKIGK